MTMRARRSGVVPAFWKPAETDQLVGYFVSPTATGGGTGDEDDPWTLDEAASQDTNLQGKRLSSARNGEGGMVLATHVWVKGGTYARTSGLAPTTKGTPANPVIFRRQPGTGILDLASGVSGNGTRILDLAAANTADVWFWGWRIRQTDTSDIQKQGVWMKAPRCRLINCVIDDVSGTGVGFWTEAPDSWMYGNIIYNVGWDDGVSNSKVSQATRRPLLTTFSSVLSGTGTMPLVQRRPGFKTSPLMGTSHFKTASSLGRTFCSVARHLLSI
jgi:hypothetical protein